MRKCIKKFLFKRKLDRLMKSENIKVRKYCAKRDWDNVAKWLHINKASFKAFRRMQKLK
jgi:hypothetical protein